MARAKSSDGQGSVYAIKKDGKVLRYRWEIMVGYLPNGHKDVRRGSEKKEADAVKAMRLVASKKDAHVLPAASAAKGAVADLMSAYLVAKKAEASAKTYAKEEQFATLHITPHVGKIKQEKLTAAHVRELLAKLDAEGLATETVRGIKGTLARALDQAVLDDILPRNVARLERKKRTRRVARTADRTHAFTPEDVDRLITTAAADRYAPLWSTLLHTGMRFGEVAALTWRDFDQGARTITVNRSLEHAEGGAPIYSDPKTFASCRTIRVPATVADLLAARRQAQATEKMAARTVVEGTVVDEYKAHDLIFCASNGAPLVHSNLWRSFKGLLGRAHLGGTIHTCRHTAATNMLHAGVPLNEVSHILGHAGVEVTAKVYAHAIPRGADSAWEAPRGLRGLDLLEAWYSRVASSPVSSPAPVETGLARAI